MHKKTYGRRQPLRSLNNIPSEDAFEKLRATSFGQCRNESHKTDSVCINNSSSSSSSSSKSSISFSGSVALFKSPAHEEAGSPHVLRQTSFFASRPKPRRRWKLGGHTKRRAVVVDTENWQEIEDFQLVVESKISKNDRPICGNPKTSTPNTCHVLPNFIGADSQCKDLLSADVSPLAMVRPCWVELTPLPVLLRKRHSSAKRKVFCSSPFHLSNWMANAKSQVLKLCQQEEPLSFTTLLPRKALSVFHKIGEGSYGEVFRSGLRVLKVVPIQGDHKSFQDSLSEIIISRELSRLAIRKNFFCPTFIRLHRVNCARGRYPKKLVQSWKTFAVQRETENQCPEIFTCSQLYVLYHFADGGTALESYQFASTEQIVSVISQVSVALAVAESALEFEHRDLHWGNVLVAPAPVEDDLSYILRGRQISVPSRGVVVSIIDFTLSRLASDGCILYTNLSDDPAIFEGSGDDQFDVYREMRKINGDDWTTFHPATNILWLRYLLKKLTTDGRYPCKPRWALTLLKKWCRSIHCHSSATQFVCRVLYPK